MRRTTSAPVLVLSIVLLGCGEVPEIAGKVIVSRNSETHVLQTGNDGKDSFDEDDDLDAQCTTHESLYVKLVNKHKYSARAGFSAIFMRAENDIYKILPLIWNVYIEIDDEAYDSLCPVVYREIADDPYEAEVSTSACELYPHRDNRDLTHPFIESAFFHVRSCGSDPLPE
ncbi:uncharacterized protein SOCEGT47_061430 [Sorangium cellulosum]|uniref:Uncharacterized protein n=1 Tax=Sorangium cellulosum TaxID=56 RepID=A0A4P2Q7W4_SORCE|nr:hypothetical protein [Sorangium cellulosum]AUX25595.1 uncharacterized protein SOCEGT47_061430 [Sorangium cellulosum]